MPCDSWVSFVMNSPCGGEYQFICSDGEGAAQSELQIMKSRVEQRCNITGKLSGHSLGLGLLRFSGEIDPCIPLSKHS